MDASRLKQLADLYDRRKGIETELRFIKAEVDVLSAELVEDFMQDGISSMKMDGRTFYIHSQTWATSKGNPRGAVEALLALNMPECLMMGTMRVSGMIREEGEEEFFAQYPELRDAIGTEVRTSVRMRKG